MTGGIGAGVYGPQGLWGWLAPNGSIALTDSSPSQTFEEPFTPEEIKAFLKIPVRSPTDPEEDALVCDLISAARVVAEYFQGRDLVRKQWDLHLDFWIDYFIKLRDNLISVDLFQVRDSDGSYNTLVENTDFIVDPSKSPGLVAPPYNEMWFTFTPWPSSAILIRFTCGIPHYVSVLAGGRARGQSRDAPADSRLVLEQTAVRKASRSCQGNSFRRDRVAHDRRPEACRINHHELAFDRSRRNAPPDRHPPAAAVLRCFRERGDYGSVRVGIREDRCGPGHRCH